MYICTLYNRIRKIVIQEQRLQNTFQFHICIFMKVMYVLWLHMKLVRSMDQIVRFCKTEKVVKNSNAQVETPMLNII